MNNLPIKSAYDCKWDGGGRRKRREEEKEGKKKKYILIKEQDMAILVHISRCMCGGGKVHREHTPNFYLGLDYDGEAAAVRGVWCWFGRDFVASVTPSPSQSTILVVYRTSFTTKLQVGSPRSSIPTTISRRRLDHHGHSLTILVTFYRALSESWTTRHRDKLQPHQSRCLVTWRRRMPKPRPRRRQ